MDAGKLLVRLNSLRLGAGEGEKAPLRIRSDNRVHACLPGRLESTDDEATFFCRLIVYVVRCLVTLQSVWGLALPHEASGCVTEGSVRVTHVNGVVFGGVAWLFSLHHFFHDLHLFTDNRRNSHFTGCRSEE